MNKEIIILRGLPGSGKSRYARQLAQSFPEIFVRVSRYDIRIMLGIEGGLGTPDQEAIVTAIEKAQAQAALDQDKTPIIDAMNLNNRFVKEWFKMGKGRVSARPLEVQKSLPLRVRDEATRQRRRRHGISRIMTEHRIPVKLDGARVGWAEIDESGEGGTIYFDEESNCPPFGVTIKDLSIYVEQVESC